MHYPSDTAYPNIYEAVARVRPLLGYKRTEWTDENIEIAIQLVYPNASPVYHLVVYRKLREWCVYANFID